MSTTHLLYLLPKIAGVEEYVDGRRDVVTEEILAAMGRIRDERASKLLRLKYLDQHMFAQDVYVALYTDTVMRRKRPWPEVAGHRPELVRDLCKLAIDEHCGPQLCSTCNGIGSFRNGALVVNCGECLGGGRRRRRDHMEQLGIETNHRYWRGVYAQAMTMLDIWEGMGLADIRTALGDEG